MSGIRTKPQWDYQAWTLAIQVLALSHNQRLKSSASAALSFTTWGEGSSLKMRANMRITGERVIFTVLRWNLAGDPHGISLPLSQNLKLSQGLAFNLKPKPWFKADLDPHLANIFWVYVLKKPQAGFVLFKGHGLLFERWRRECFHFINIVSYVYIVFFLFPQILKCFRNHTKGSLNPLLKYSS